jgi:hypothetical protein
LTDGSDGTGVYSKITKSALSLNPTIIRKMKVIDAIWEKRNTGLKTCELVFSSEDSINDYLDNNIEKNYEHIVAKVPADNIVLVHQLEDYGYRFMETQFSISVAAHELDKIDQKWNRVLAGTSYKKVDNRNDLELLLTNIKAGMFTDDRISMDERFGINVSYRRYVNWIVDIYEDKKAEIFILEKNISKAGFFIIKQVNRDVLHSIIAGIFKEYQGQGLSIALIYFYLKIAVDRNARYVNTFFSSNNQKMLNTFTKTVSFKTLNICYVLRKVIES